MSAPIKNSTTDGTSGDDGRFPPEVYAPCDDVTPEAVNVLREKAAGAVEGRKWKRVDGFGLSKSF